MNASDAMADRHAALLQDLAALGMGVARDLAERVAAAESPGEAEGLALAFHRVSRSVRQTLALEARLARDLRTLVREDQDRARAETRRRIDQRKARVHAAVARDLWTEYEADEADGLNAQLFERLEAEAEDDAFLEGPIEACIARIRASLGLPPNDTPLECHPGSRAAAIRDP